MQTKQENICDLDCPIFQSGQCEKPEQILINCSNDFSLAEFNKAAEIYNIPVQYWYFTFGYDHAHPDKYVKIYGTFGSARKDMFDHFGDKWAFQYSSEDAIEINRYGITELELPEL